MANRYRRLLQTHVSDNASPVLSQLLVELEKPLAVRKRFHYALCKKLHWEVLEKLKKRHMTDLTVDDIQVSCRMLPTLELADCWSRATTMIMILTIML